MDKFKYNPLVYKTSENSGILKLPRGENFVSFIKWKRKLLVMTNKSVGEIVMVNKRDKE